MRNNADASPSTRARRARPRRSASAESTTVASAAQTIAPIKPVSASVPGPAAGENEKVRVSKLMSERGLCSRREADEYIERGWVYVDGVRVDELGTRIDPTQAITLDKRAENISRVTVLLHKPVGYVSGQAEQGYRPAITLIVPDNRCGGDNSSPRFQREHLKGLAPAGRLDIDSTGLLVFTQDGRIAKLLIGEDSPIEKEYLVRVDGKLDAAGLKLLNHGLSLDGVPLKPAMVSWLNRDQLRFILREGKKRQIRRMCELVGLRVIGLKRVRIGRIALADLPEGQWRYLREHEKF
jgi:23S rRNA pseudouridine2604 synthase